MSESVFEGLDVLHLAKCDHAKTGLSWSVFLSPETLLQAVRRLYEAEYALEDITAIDAKEGYLVVYHFDHMDRSGRVALRVLIPHEAPQIPSIASIFNGAEWHERETMDFYGIDFAGNPNPVPLILPADMKEHPLQKAEAARSSIADMIPPGEVLRASPDFTLLTPPPAAGAESTH